jgi:hypothetical protein
MPKKFKLVFFEYLPYGHFESVVLSATSQAKKISHTGAFKTEVPDMESTRPKTRQQQHEFWYRHVVAWSKSGLSQKAYAAQVGLEYSSLCRWRRFFEHEPGRLPAVSQAERLPAHKPACDRRKNTQHAAPQVEKLPVHSTASLTSKPVILPFGGIRLAAGKAAFLLNREGRYRLEIPADFEQDSLARLLNCLETHL